MSAYLVLMRGHGPTKRAGPPLEKLGGIYEGDCMVARITCPRFLLAMVSLMHMPTVAWSDAPTQSEPGQSPPAASRLLLVTVPENGNVAYSEHHTTPLQPFNLLGQAVVLGARAANEKAMNQFNAEQSPIIAKSVADYPFEDKIVDTAKGMASRNPWLETGSVVVNHDMAPKVAADVVATSDAAGIVQLSCLYRFSLSFDALVLHCNFASQNKAKGTPGDTPDGGDARLGNRMFEIYVPLENGNASPAAKNASRWQERGGALTRSALDMAIGKLPGVLDTGLAMVPAPGKPIPNVKRIGHYQGSVAQKDDVGTLLTVAGVIWSYEFAHGVGA
jgi:hypothetical protein